MLNDYYAAPEPPPVNLLSAVDGARLELPDLGDERWGESDLIRYAYWSNRRVRSIAEDNGIVVSRTPKAKLSVFKVPITSTSLDIELESRTLYRAEIARKIEKAFAGSLDHDFTKRSPPLADACRPVEARWRCYRARERASGLLILFLETSCRSAPPGS